MSAIIILVIFYLIFYASLVKKPRIIFQKNAFNISVVSQVKVFNTFFWPFFIYGFGYLQSKLYQYRPSLFREHKQIIIKTKDGEALEMDMYDKENIEIPLEKECVGRADIKNEECSMNRKVVNNVLLVHGFNGSSRVSYIKSLAYYLDDFRVFAFNARGVISELKTPKFFHIGWTDDLEVAVNHILCNYSGTLSMVGFSMGSSWVISYLAKFDNPRIVAGVGVCVPFNFMKLRNIFKSTLKEKLLAKEFKKYLSRHTVFKSFKFNFNSVDEIDEHVTIKIFGFNSCEEYYTKESCEGKLDNIKKPILFINSSDDPIIPCATIPIDKIKRNPNCILCIANTGGHLGFLGANWYKSFVDKAIIDFLSKISN